MVRRLIPFAIGVSSILVAALALAALPPLESVGQRLASVRAESKKALVSARASVTDGGVTDYEVTALTVTVGEPIKLVGPADKTLTIGPDAPAPWALVSALLVAPDPLGALGKAGVRPDADHAVAVPLDDDLGYQYGTSPTMIVTPDLAQVRQLVARQAETTWTVLSSGRVGDTHLPALVQVMRDGRPYATVTFEGAD